MYYGVCGGDVNTDKNASHAYILILDDPRKSNAEYMTLKHYRIHRYSGWIHKNNGNVVVGI
jgi:hypothetical protein